MHIHPERSHPSLLSSTRRERGGTHDKDGFVLAAHPGKSQGRPANNAGSQLISQNGLPIRVSQKPHVPGTPMLPEGRTAVSSPDNGNEFRGGFEPAINKIGARHTRIRAGRPQTNGHVERLHRTILEEC